MGKTYASRDYDNSTKVYLTGSILENGEERAPRGGESDLGGGDFEGLRIIGWGEIGDEFYKGYTDVEEVCFIGLPNSMAFDVPKECFHNCTNLHTVVTHDTMPGKVATIWEKAFQHNPKLTTIRIINKNQQDQLRFYHRTFAYNDVDLDHYENRTYQIDIPNADLYMGRYSLLVGGNVADSESKGDNDIQITCKHFSWNSEGDTWNTYGKPALLLKINCSSMENHGNIRTRTFKDVEFTRGIYVNDPSYIRALFGSESHTVECSYVKIIKSNKNLGDRSKEKGFDLGSFGWGELKLEIEDGVEFNKMNLRRDDIDDGDSRIYFVLDIPNAETLYKITWYDHSGINHSWFKQRYICIRNLDTNTTTSIPDSGWGNNQFEYSLEIPCPDGITTIPDYMLNGVTGITQIEIGKNVQTIGNMAFSGLNELTDMVYNKIDDSSFGDKRLEGEADKNKDERDKLYLFKFTRSMTVTIGESVKCIPAYFIWVSGNQLTVKLPVDSEKSKLEVIKKCAFRCKNIVFDDVYFIPTLKEISNNFVYYTDLESVNSLRYTKDYKKLYDSSLTNLAKSSDYYVILTGKKPAQNETLHWHIGTIHPPLTEGGLIEADARLNEYDTELDFDNLFNTSTIGEFMYAIGESAFACGISCNNTEERSDFVLPNTLEIIDKNWALRFTAKDSNKALKVKLNKELRLIGEEGLIGARNESRASKYYLQVPNFTCVNISSKAWSSTHDWQNIEFENFTALENWFFKTGKINFDDGLSQLVANCKFFINFIDSSGKKYTKTITKLDFNNDKQESEYDNSYECMRIGLNVINNYAFQKETFYKVPMEVIEINSEKCQTEGDETLFGKECAAKNLIIGDLKEVSIKTDYNLFDLNEDTIIESCVILEAPASFIQYGINNATMNNCKRLNLLGSYCGEYIYTNKPNLTITPANGAYISVPYWGNSPSDLDPDYASLSGTKSLIKLNPPDDFDKWRNFKLQLTKVEKICTNFNVATITKKYTGYDYIIEYLTLPSTLKEIDYNAFGFAPGGKTRLKIKNLNYQGTLEKWYGIEFKNCYSSPFSNSDSDFIFTYNCDTEELKETISNDNDFSTSGIHNTIHITDNFKKYPSNPKEEYGNYEYYYDDCAFFGLEIQALIFDKPCKGLYRNVRALKDNVSGFTITFNKEFSENNAIKYINWKPLSEQNQIFYGEELRNTGRLVPNKEGDKSYNYFVLRGVDENGHSNYESARYFKMPTEVDDITQWPNEEYTFYEDDEVVLLDQKKSLYLIGLKEGDAEGNYPFGQTFKLPYYSSSTHRLYVVFLNNTIPKNTFKFLGDLFLSPTAGSTNPLQTSPIELHLRDTVEYIDKDGLTKGWDKNDNYGKSQCYSYRYIPTVASPNGSELELDKYIINYLADSDTRWSFTNMKYMAQSGLRDWAGDPLYDDQGYWFYPNQEDSNLNVKILLELDIDKQNTNKTENYTIDIWTPENLTCCWAVPCTKPISAQTQNRLYSLKIRQLGGSIYDNVLQPDEVFTLGNLFIQNESGFIPKLKSVEICPPEDQKAYYQPEGLETGIFTGLRLSKDPKFKIDTPAGFVSNISSKDIKRFPDIKANDTDDNTIEFTISNARSIPSNLIKDEGRGFYLVLDNTQELDKGAVQVKELDKLTIKLGEKNKLLIKEENFQNAVVHEFNFYTKQSTRDVEIINDWLQKVDFYNKESNFMNNISKFNLFKSENFNVILEPIELSNGTKQHRLGSNILYHDHLIRSLKFDTSGDSSSFQLYNARGEKDSTGLENSHALVEIFNNKYNLVAGDTSNEVEDLYFKPGIDKNSYIEKEISEEGGEA